MEDLKMLRKKAGLTQKDVYRMYEIPERTLQNWENGTNPIPKYVYNFYVEKLNEFIRNNCN